MRRILSYMRYGQRVLERHGLRETLRMGGRLLKDFGVLGMMRALSYRATGGMSLSRDTAEKQRSAGWLMPHTASVDIIVCVHNALEDVTNCLNSVVRHTLPPYRLILVDDGSDAPTRDYLHDFAAAQGALLLRNETAQGYTKAANKGLQTSIAAWAVLLNSDTVVTPYWLDRMVRCGESSSSIGLVGPLSNAASWQSVPQVMREDGDWEENPLPPGVTLDQWAQEIASIAPLSYPRVGLLNGFCLMIRRELRRNIGNFDEEAFGAGYGEENDYCLRVRKMGRELAIADDAFVWHAQSRSYSHERRRELCRRADEALHAKHGSEAIFAALRLTERHPALEGVRARMSVMLERQRLREETRRLYEGKRVFFLLPALDAGGGGNIIVREAQALSEMGVDAEIVNDAMHAAGFKKNYPWCRVPVRYLSDPAEIAGIARKADVLVATLFTTVDMLAQCVVPLPEAERPQLVYYIQDFEPYFFPPEDPRHRQAWDGYTKIPGMKLVCKTSWNQQELLEKTGARATVIGPSYRWDAYHPRQQKAHPGSKVRIIAMVRPATPRRSPELTMRVLARLKKRFGAKIAITVFGVSSRDADYRKLDRSFSHRNVGTVSADEVAALLADSDIFLDLSTYQAMGLTALEAMASQVAVVAPRRGGAGEFITHETSGLLVDTQDEEACFCAAERLVADEALRQQIQQNALHAAARHYPEICARGLLDAVYAQDATNSTREREGAGEDYASARAV